MNYLLSKFGDEQCMVHNRIKLKSELETSPCFSPALKVVLLAQSHAPIRTEAQSHTLIRTGNKSMWLYTSTYPGRSWSYPLVSHHQTVPACCSQTDAAHTLSQDDAQHVRTYIISRWPTIECCGAHNAA